MLAVDLIKQKKPGFKPTLGIVCGSGLGHLADAIEDKTEISYEELPSFPIATVKGHHGTLALGTLNGINVACLKGRGHYYEGHDNKTMQTPIRTLKALGCDTVFITNSAASLRPDVTPGNLVLINDHINFQFNNPLVGANDENVGPRFPALTDAYDPSLRNQLKQLGANLDIQLREGVYIGVLGPCYETPAEIRAFRLLGADVVGMSTVSDVIVARHCGLKVITISTITNMAAGMIDEHLNHNDVLLVAKSAGDKLAQLILAFAKDMHCAV